MDGKMDGWMGWMETLISRRETAPNKPGSFLLPTTEGTSLSAPQGNSEPLRANHQSPAHTRLASQVRGLEHSTKPTLWIDCVIANAWHSRLSRARGGGKEERGRAGLLIPPEPSWSTERDGEKQLRGARSRVLSMMETTRT